MKPGDKDKADTGENRALRLACGATGVKTFFYRYTSPLTHKIAQTKIGHFPNISLAKASLAQAKMRLNSTPGKRILSDNELIQMLNWLPHSAYPANATNILRLTLWTGCRTGEICNMAWKDVNLDKGTIHLRETKSGIERHVQLSLQATQFLQSLYTEKEQFVFPSRISHEPVQQSSLTFFASKLRKKGKMLDIPHWTPHDLRRTVRTGLARLKCPSEIAEVVLGHSRKSIEGTYDLHRYEDECKVWLQKWADYLDTLKV